MTAFGKLYGITVGDGFMDISRLFVKFKITFLGIPLFVTVSSLWVILRL